MAYNNGAASSTPLLDSLESERARYVLYYLVRNDPAIATRAEDVARTILGAVDSEKVADMLADELSDLAIEDVWDTSGRTRDGDYIDTTERAWEMMDEVVSSYTDEMMAYIRRGMPEESRRYCSGILMGLRHTGEKSGSPLCEEAPDYCDETFSIVRDDWEEAVGDAEQIRLLACFLEENELI